MAFQSNKSGGQTKDIAGAVDKTRTSKPAPMTYRAPKLDRGRVVVERVDFNGDPLPQTNYGRNCNAYPSSVGVVDSAGDRARGLSDFDIRPNYNDDVLMSLVANGHGDSSGENSAEKDLSRKIDPTPYPSTFGCSGAATGPKIPGALVDNEGQPERQPLPGDTTVLKGH